MCKGTVADRRLPLVQRSRQMGCTFVFGRPNAALSTSSYLTTKIHRDVFPSRGKTVGTLRGSPAKLNAAHVTHFTSMMTHNGTQTPPRDINQTAFTSLLR